MRGLVPAGMALDVSQPKLLTGVANPVKEKGQRELPFFRFECLADQNLKAAPARNAMILVSTSFEGRNMSYSAIAVMIIVSLRW